MLLGAISAMYIGAFIDAIPIPKPPIILKTTSIVTVSGSISGKPEPQAEIENNIAEIRNYGSKLIWNKYLNQDQLSKIKEVVENKIERHPELEKLKLDAFNKQFSYDRITLDSKRIG